MTHRSPNAPLLVVLAQLDLMVGDVAGNLDRIIAAAERARDQHHADVIAFPELALVSYPPEDLLLRPGMRPRVERALQTLRERVQGIAVVLGHPHHQDGKVYNAASVFRDGERLALYFKHALPNYSVFDEKRYFAAGSRPATFEVRGHVIGLSICEDIWQPQPTRLAVQAGARLILNMNASPFHHSKGDEREAVVRQRVQENGVPVLYVNLVGGQDELVFDGNSFSMGSDGEVMSRAPAYQDTLLPVQLRLTGNGLQIAPGEVAPRLSEEASVYRGLVTGVRDYISKNGFPGAIIGLSGGIDSALTLAIAVDALGADRVQAVMMPSRYTADISLEDARAEAEALGVDYQVLPIEPVFSAFLDALSGLFEGLPVDSTEENIQARCRGVMLMALSNKSGRMVLTTGNKSEMAVGYATLYGDMAGGFAVIKDVPKTLVFRLSAYRNSLSPVIPQRVLERPPSAELAEDQQDTDSLPPYDVLDPILQMYVEEDRSPRQIIASGYAEQDVRRVLTLVDRNEYKRRQAPPGIRVTRRAFGRDRRYPLTSGYGRSEDWLDG